ncbi:MAG: flagellar hook-length control protein FliK [Burkholderiaceae bacterium]
MEQARITSQPPSQTQHTVRGKQPGSAHDAAGPDQDSGGGGFLSLLAALGDSVLPEGMLPQDAGLALDENKPVAAAGDAQDGAVVWPWMTVSADAFLQRNVDAGTLSSGMVAPASELSVSSPEVATAALVGGGNAVQGALGGLDALPQNGLVAQTALLDSAAQNADGVRESAGVRRAPARVNGSLVSVGGVPATVGSSATQALKSLGGTKESGVMQSLQAVAAQMPGPEHHSAAVSSRDGMRLLGQVGQDQAMSMAPLAAMVPGFSESGGRSMAQGGDRGGSAATGFGGQGLNADTQGASPVDTGAVAVDPGMIGTEEGVAEQVAFWVRQNIQNAEMTIQHEGQAVEVSVSLTGNEAHVAFGSYQAETRSLLDGSVAQLREMLRQEGLSLSGVTVGESGQRQGSEQSGRSHEQGASRKAVVEVPMLSQGRARIGAGLQTDRSVDIFV